MKSTVWHGDQYGEAEVKKKKIIKKNMCDG